MGIGLANQHMSVAPRHRVWRASPEENTLIPLHADARLRFDEGACLPLRSNFGGCRACASACPAHVLDVTVERVALSEGCLHCGRCMAACPTEALRLEGFEFTQLPPARAPLEVECAKVPLEHRSRHGVTVPCLGGLSVGRIAALHEAAGESGVEVIDRGWCARCTAGGGSRHPVAAALALAVTWLDAIADPRPAPCLRSAPLPIAQMPAAIPLPPEHGDEGPALTRRQFFRAVATDPLARERNATPMGRDGRAAYPPSRRVESPERQRLIAALDAAAERAGTPLPAELFPQLTASAACVDHGVCAAACPTGALKVASGETSASLRFAAEACIGCGACARACPEKALALAMHGGARTTVTIARHGRRVCSTCGDTYTPREGEDMCQACAKSRGFIGDAMRQLYAARH